jgi:hypothetical protein
MLVDTPEAIAAGRRLALALALAADGSASGLDCGLLPPVLCVCVTVWGGVVR